MKTLLVVACTWLTLFLTTSATSDPNLYVPANRSNHDDIHYYPLSQTYDNIGDIDYCSLACGTQHIGCKENSLTPVPGCPKTPIVQDMQSFQQIIVDYHNHVRNDVAGGNYKHLPPASRMGTIRWDDGLYRTAQIKANLCSTVGDNCHATPEFQASGQNIGLYGYIGETDRLTLEFIIENHLEKWVNRSHECTAEIIDSFPNATESKQVPGVGLFTIMVRDGNTHVGCSINRYEIVHGHVKTIFVCHYATNNFIGEHTYKAGPSGSDCKTGINPQYPNLCGEDEVYSYDHH